MQRGSEGLRPLSQLPEVTTEYPQDPPSWPPEGAFVSSLVLLFVIVERHHWLQFPIERQQELDLSIILRAGGDTHNDAPSWASSARFAMLETISPAVSGVWRPASRGSTRR